MKNSSLGLFLIPGAAFLAFILPFLGKASLPAKIPISDEQASPKAMPATSQAAEKTREKEINSTARKAAKLLCEFAAIDTSQCEKNLSTRNAITLLPNANIAEVQYLIATVPDPKESNFDYLFDRYVESIQRALEAEEYTIDRYYLPWLQTKEARKKEIEQNLPPRYLQEPGVLLFRKNSAAKTHLLFLFLVGETPTSGISKIALHDAFTQVENLRQILPESRPVSCDFRLLAPSFSGSATSLAQTIKDWRIKHPAACFNIITGSATAIDKNELLIRAGCERSSFAATITSSKDDLETFRAYLHRLKGGETPPRFAMLREANTAYGQAFKEGATKENNQANQPSDLDMVFPLHISNLRAEVEKGGNTNLLPGQLNNAPHLHTSLRMGDGNEETALFPMFSNVETAAQELVVANLLSAINKEGVQYVGLIASDAQDRIFLAREVRLHCPNATLFTLNADLLYLHPDANADFQGTLVVTSYPLFSPNQFWTYPFNGPYHRLQFSIPSAQGVYNAALALLGNKPSELMLEYGTPFDTFLEPDKHEKLVERTPALWVSVVGRNRIWPLTVLPHKSQDILYKLSSPAETPQKKDAIKYLPLLTTGKASSKSSLLLLLIISALSCLPSGILLLQLVHGKYRKWLSLSNPNTKFLQYLQAHPLAQFCEQYRVMKWLRKLILQIEQSWLARVFSDPTLPDDNLKFARRNYQLACCLVLTITSSLVAFTYFLPLIASFKLQPSEPALEIIGRGLWQNLVGYGCALLVFCINLGATIWLFVSLLDWRWGESIKRLGQKILTHRITSVIARVVPNPKTVGWVTMTLISVLFFVGLDRLPRKNVNATASYSPLPLLSEAWITVKGTFLEILQLQPQDEIFFFVRATDLAGGNSPLLPLLFIGLAIFLAYFCALRRVVLLERMYCALDEKKGELHPFLNFDNRSHQSFIGIRELELKLKEILHLPAHELKGRFFVIVTALTLCGYLFAFRLSQTIEVKLFPWVFGGAMLLVMITLGLSFLRFLSLWRALRMLLRRLSYHPLFAAPVETSRVIFQDLPKIEVAGVMPSYTSLVYSVEQARKLDHLIAQEPKEITGPNNVSFLTQLVGSAEDKLLEAYAAKSNGNWRTMISKRCEAQGALANISALVANLMESHWRVPNERFAVPANNDGQWVQQAEIFLASRITALLRQVFVQMQNLAGFITLGFLLLLLATTSYPFQPHELLLLFGWIIALASIVSMLAVFVQMERDKVLSLLSGRTPGEINLHRNLIVKIFIHGVVPIMALLGAQFPNTLRQLFSWIGALQGGGH